MIKNSNTAPKARAVMACLSWALACDAPALDPGATASEVADSSETAGFELDVLAVKDCQPEAHSALDSDEVLLGVQVKVSARTSGVPQNYYYGRLEDAEGLSYAANFAGCEPRLAGKPLLAGETGRGFINFRLPRRAQGLKLVYAPRLAASKKSRGPDVARELGR